MTEDLFTRKQMENAVMLAADLYQGMYNSPAFAMRAPKNLRPQCKALGLPLRSSKRSALPLGLSK